MTTERAILGPRIYKASMAGENGVFVSIDMANSLLDQIDALRAKLEAAETERDAARFNLQREIGEWLEDSRRMSEQLAERTRAVESLRTKLVRCHDCMHFEHEAGCAPTACEICAALAATAAPPATLPEMREVALGSQRRIQAAIDEDRANDPNVPQAGRTPATRRMPNDAR